MSSTLTLTTPPIGGGNIPNIIVADPSPAHTRPYDFNLGDQRFFDRDRAIAAAEERVVDRGCRQQVRTVHVSNPLITPRWLVQDI